MGTTPPITTNNPQNTRSTKPDQTNGYGPVAPVKPRKSFKLAGALCAVGMLLALSPFIAWTVIDLIPGNHGDGGDGMYWLAVGMMFYILPIGLILIVASIITALVVAVMNSSAKG